MSKRDLEELITYDVKVAIIKSTIFKIIRNFFIKHNLPLKNIDLYNEINNMPEDLLKKAIENIGNKIEYDSFIKNICQQVIKNLIDKN